MPYPKTSEIHYHALVGISDKDLAIKRLVVCKTFHAFLKQDLVHWLTKIRASGISHPLEIIKVRHS